MSTDIAATQHTFEASEPTGTFAPSAHDQAATPGKGQSAIEPPAADVDLLSTASRPAPLRTRPGVRFVEWRRRYTASVLVVDAVVGMLAVFATGHLYGPATHFSSVKLSLLILGAALAWPLGLAICHGYDQRKVGVGDDEFRAVVQAVVLAIAATAVPSAVVEHYGVVALSVVAIPTAGGLSLLVRLGGRQQLARLQRAGLHVRNLIVVGSLVPATELVDVLAREQHGMRVIGVCVPEHQKDRARNAGLTVLGSMADVAETVRVHRADSVAVTGGEATRHLFLKGLAWSLEGADVELLVHPGLVEVAGPRMHIRPHVGLPLLHVEQPNFSGWRRFVKRATDLVLTSMFMVVFAPLFIAIAIAIKLDGGGPVFYSQLRVGLDGSIFRMWKFRSMHVDADRLIAELRHQNPGIGMLFKMQDDPRVTRVGKLLRKFSLDELPQLFNVLDGSMSLVGPRPPLQVEVDGYENRARRRLLVAPGLTGLWQVSGRSLLSWDESIRLDLRYVENWTLTLDLLILWRTLFAVLTRRGAF